MTAHPALIAWPEDPSDAAGLALWTSDEIALATGGRASAPFAVSGVEIDSRDVVEGDLFFALKGETSDGHRYLEGAAGRGAPGSVVEHACFGPHVLVPDTMAALEALGRHARARVDAAIIGVTGSAGKTGVKEALYAALDRASRGRAHRSVKSYNNHVGVPLSLARMPASTRFGVFEMGMNHAGELAALTRMVRPHVAIVTTIAPAHIGHFTGEEDIADAKGEIFEGLEPGGTAIIPADSPHCELLRAKAAQHAGRVISFGTKADADVRLLDAVPAPGGGTLVTADLGGRKVCYTIAQPGEHWVANSLAIMAAVDAIGGDLGAAGLALAEMEGLAGRGARHTIPAQGGDGSGKALLIDESYNANPISMIAAFKSLGARKTLGRRIVALTDMLELGEAGPQYHAGLAEALAQAGIDQVFCAGPLMKSLWDALPPTRRGGYAESAAELAPQVTRAVEPGDLVMVKGSNGSKAGAVTAALAALDVRSGKAG
ncbi:MAG: UDP-N-acetylmuramoylalanyl-D-glutamyl-2, 6-diaminopimelate--D-alanyl-D-alanine ligase [Novosphingobium sp. 16-62-11]|nr:MAG: UDP-N-acetylmuramoylalanyl-D-glutamyl-2, 6-diaminopimelate--D-alanyl-D-alanine ligase [Novosphingobium sp. 16-62-11]